MFFSIWTVKHSNSFISPHTLHDKVLISVAASAPAITGEIGMIGRNGAVHNGCFYNARTGGTLNNQGEPDNVDGFDASRSSSIYGASNTIRPISRRARFMIRF